MFDRDKWQEIFQTLKQNKLRTALTAFGVFWGIFMLIIMLGAGNGLRNAVFYGFENFATNSAFTWTRRTTMPYQGFDRGRRWNFTNRDMQALRENIPEIKYLAPRLQGTSRGSVAKVTRGLQTGDFNIYGDFPDYAKIDPQKILKGRFINDYDIKYKRKVAVIGTRVREVLFEKDENPLGKYIDIDGVYFQVIGVFKPINTKISFGGNPEELIYIPFTASQVAFNFGDVVHYFAVTAKDGVPVSVVDKKAKTLLKKWHRIHPDDDRAIGGFNLEKEVQKVNGLFLGINVLVWIVGIGTLLAGVIGVSNIMLIVVKERTKEIGIKRAIGAQPASIIGQIILESVFLTAVAGFAGLVAGVWLLELINAALTSAGGNSEAFRNPEVNFGVAFTALVIIVVSGAFAGLLPAQRAISIKPIDALRDE